MANICSLSYIYTVTLPDRVGAVHACLGDELRTRANIHIHGGQDDSVESSWRATSHLRRLGTHCKSERPQGTCAARV